MWARHEWVLHLVRACHEPAALTLGFRQGKVIARGGSAKLTAAVVLWDASQDGDTIFLDFAKNFSGYMASGQHMFWQIRLNKEVTAAAALIRCCLGGM